MKLLNVVTTMLSALLLSYFSEVQSMSVLKEQGEMTISMAEQMLNDQPVLVKGEDNSVGVIVENLTNFPNQSDNEEWTEKVETNRDNLLTLPSLDEHEKPSVINLDGNPTQLVLADFQRRLFDVLRDGGKNPKATFKPDTQIVVTPNGEEKKINMNIAVWVVK